MAGLFKTRYPNEELYSVHFDRSNIIVNSAYCAKFKVLSEFLRSQDGMVSIGTGCVLDNREIVF